MTIPKDQDGTAISEGDILLDSRGRTYAVGKTDATILAQGIVSGQRRNSKGELPPEYVRAYHAFIIAEHTDVETGKRLHRRRLAIDSASRRAKMRERHTSTDQLLRDRGIRSG